MKYQSKLKKDYSLPFVFTYIIIFLLFVVGWIMNIINIIRQDDLELTGTLILQIIGIFVAPLGAIMGWVV